MELYDTYTKELIDLPLPPGPVRMYICGPTVYARAHVGNARPFVIGMWWRSWLKAMGYNVTFVHNITDVNDKIYDAAGDGSSAELAKEATAWYQEDIEALGLGMPEEMPKVSLNVPVIVEYIEKLIEAGHAYEVDGDVYFRVASFPDYGKLSGRWEPPPEPEPGEDEEEADAEGEAGEEGEAEAPGGEAAEEAPVVEAHEEEEEEAERPAGRPSDLVVEPPDPEDMQLGEEEPDEKKEDPRDFALWKAKKEGEDTSWNSPWGRGRPGWHIECSAMAEDILGEAFEIHGGGIDLLFPHHENELAQSRALGHQFAQIWAHNGLVRFTGDKMSKSEGNVVTIQEAVEKWGRETVLLFFLSAHWRKPVDFSDETMAQAQARAETFRNAFTQQKMRRKLQLWDDLSDALEDDFDTPRALAVMHDWASSGQHDNLIEALEIFGLKSLSEPEPAPDDIVALAEARMAAREAKDFAEADRLREEIRAAGWDMRDRISGYVLKKKQ
jgi:cysteinyl-tRNA synthetase